MVKRSGEKGGEEVLRGVDREVARTESERFERTLVDRGFERGRGRASDEWGQRVGEKIVDCRPDRRGQATFGEVVIVQGCAGM